MGDEDGDKIVGIKNVIGSSGDDTLTGDDKANILEGHFGADILIGGDGNDTASYKRSHEAVTVDLNQQGDDPDADNASPQEGGDAEGDKLYGFENLQGSAKNDVLTGDNSANSLFGEGGDDLLKGGQGVDALDGGAGSDTADFRNRSDLSITLGADGAATTAKSVDGNVRHRQEYRERLRQRG